MISLTLLLATLQAAPPQIPFQISTSSSSQLLRQDYQEGRVSISASQEQHIDIRWTASVLNNGTQPPDFTLPLDPAKNALGSFKWNTGLQSLRMRFYPTAVSVIDGKALLIGGITPGGDTVIERWSLEWPLPMPVPVTNQQTGITSVSVALPSVGIVRRPFQANETGKQYVRGLCGIKPPSGQTTAEALVQFHDSSEVYRMNLASGALTLLASGTAASGTFGLVPTLATPSQLGIEFGDKIGAGYAYVFQPGSLPNPTDKTLVLLDADRNGTVESMREIDRATYLAEGWHSLANYNNWWLD